jgi:hypothetical protein
MGVVYRAHDLALDRNVALKLLARELAADVRFRERFLPESGRSFDQKEAGTTPPVRPGYRRGAA